MRAIAVGVGLRPAASLCTDRCLRFSDDVELIEEIQAPPSERAEHPVAVIRWLVLPRRWGTSRSLLKLA